MTQRRSPTDNDISLLDSTRSAAGYLVKGVETAHERFKGIVGYGHGSCDAFEQIVFHLNQVRSILAGEVARYERTKER